MMKIAVILLLGLVLVSAYTEQEYQTEFSSWMHKYSKTYASSEFQNRYNIFKANMDFVRDWNAKGMDHRVELNFLADLSNAEYQRIYLGTKITVPKSNIKVAPHKSIGTDYNATVDWRQANPAVVSPIKNQGQCGSCWSFSTTGSTEGAYAIANKMAVVSLSEQNLMDCSTAYGNEGCNGGLMDDAFKYIIANKGIDTEAYYPYQGVQGSCHYSAASANVGATISSYKDIPQDSETDLASAVNIGPVSVAIDAAGMSFQLYKDGIYYDLFCSQTKLDHGVLAVGYGVDSDNKNYWIVKNSWGTTWGMEGWIYMSKDRNNNCGIATAASYPIV